MNQTEIEPLVSVAMTTYNGERFLQQQLQSILDQHYKNIEIIISDDGSTDSTIDIIKLFQNTYSNIHLFKNEVIREEKGHICSTFVKMNKGATSIIMNKIL